MGPAVAAGLTVATPLLKKAGVAGDEGLGALYQAPDGSLYALHGFAEEDLHGLYETDGTDDLSAADDLNGFALDEDFQGPEAYDVQGADPASAAYVGADEPLQGYVNEDQVAGLQAYMPEPPRRTPMFEAPCEPPRVWKSNW